MITQLNNVNIYCYKLQGNPSYCRFVVCAENKESAYKHVQKIKEECKDFGDDYVIQEDDITNLESLNFEMAHTVVVNELMKKIELAEYLQSHTPNGVIVDADTILADVLEEAVDEGVESGIALDIFNIYRNSHDKAALKEMFFSLTGDYLDKVIANTTRAPEKGEEIDS